jgi:hypothetical protein
LACFVIQQCVAGLAAMLTPASLQTDRQKPADDKIKIAVEAALQRDVHRTADLKVKRLDSHARRSSLLSATR